MIKKILLFFVIFFFLMLVSNSVSGVGDDYDECSHLSNPVPANGETNANITDKGVQTCITVTPPDNCSLNITFIWFDFENYYDAWSDYRDGIGPHPEYHDYEHNYSQWTNVNTTRQLCAWNDNVTCYKEGAYPYFAWGVLTEYNCSGQSPEESLCTYGFKPEECDLFYIYPALNRTDVCPCCDHICFGINNENGSNMNATIYGSYDGVNYFTWNKYFNISNGTYCFCMDDVYLAPTPEKKGEWIGANGIQAPGAKPAEIVQHGCGISWEFSDNQEEEIQFTVRVPQRINLSYDVTLDIGWSSPATNKMCNWNLTYSTTELNEDTEKACEYYQDILVESSSTAHGLTMKRYYITEINSTDKCIHFTLERDGNDATDNLSDVANLHGICFSYYLDNDLLHVANATSPMRYNTTYYWYVNITDTITGESTESDIFTFRTEENPEECPCNESSITNIINESFTEENIIEEEEEENNMIISVGMAMFIIAIFLFILGIVMEIFNRGEEAYDNAVIIIFIMGIIFFFTAGATFFYHAQTVNEFYMAYAWLNFILGFLAVAIAVLKGANALENQGD